MSLVAATPAVGDFVQVRHHSHARPLHGWVCRMRTRGVRRSTLKGDFMMSVLDRVEVTTVVGQLLVDPGGWSYDGDLGLWIGRA